MPMRKHNKKQNFNRPMLWPNPPKQYVTTLDAYAKLLGLKTDVEQMVATIEAGKQRWLKRRELSVDISVPAPPAACRYTMRRRTEMTAADMLRMRKAADRQAELILKRAHSYARCIGGNWGKTLTENLYKATVNISRTLEVDKAFVKKFA